MASGIVLSKVPGYREALAKARIAQAKARDNAWKNLPVMIGGFSLRIMTVRDFVILDHYGSPFLYRQQPTVADIAFLFWTLSAQCNNWNESKGLRKFSCLRGIEAWLFTHGVVKSLPDIKVAQACFKYIQDIFADAPAHQDKGPESCNVSYLAYWFDLMQAEHNLSVEDIWRLPLPQLFQRIRTINMRKGCRVPMFNPMEDKLKAWIQAGISSKRFTFDDLKSGRVRFEDN